MSKFKLLNDNLYKILHRLVENKNLCKLIYYNDENPLSQSEIANSSKLLFDKIYPYPIAIDPEAEASTFLCLALDDFSLANGGYGIANNKVIFNVLCHNKLWKLKGALRPFLIMEELDNMFNDVGGIGIGKMQFSGANIIYTKDYTGYRVSYETYNANGR
jgi:hypothetical protein